METNTTTAYATFSTAADSGDATATRAPHLQPTTISSTTLSLPQRLKVVTTALRRRIAVTPLRDRVTAALVALGAISSQIMTTLGLNFWQASYGSNPLGISYVSCFIPALIWAVAFVVPTVVMVWWNAYDVRWVWERRSAGLLIGIGVLDALGGFTAVYATPHVATLVQLCVYSVGTIITYIFTRVILRQLALPMSRYLFLAFALGACGLFLAGLPQFWTPSDSPSSPPVPVVNTTTHAISHAPAVTTVWGSTTTTTTSHPDGGGSSQGGTNNEAATESTGGKIAWIAIFLLSGFIPCCYCVLQARFMRVVAPQHHRTCDEKKQESSSSSNFASPIGVGGRRVASMRRGADSAAGDVTSGESMVALDATTKHGRGSESTHRVEQGPHRHGPHAEPLLMPSTNDIHSINDGIYEDGSGQDDEGSIASDSDDGDVSPSSADNNDNGGSENRLLREKRKKEKIFHRFMVKMVMWSGDCGVQFIATAVLFPLDALPWFGASPSVAESYRASLIAARCVRDCPNNAWYLAVYATGFFTNHIFMAYLNYTSPTLASFILQQTTPLTVLILTIVPSWAVYGNPTPWYISILCLVLVFSAAALYFTLEQFHHVVTEEAKKKRRNARATGGDHPISAAGIAAID